LLAGQCSGPTMMPHCARCCRSCCNVLGLSTCRHKTRRNCSCECWRRS